MKASVDTNVIIHLYRSGCKEILFSAFDEVLVHSFIYEVELRKHGQDVLPEFQNDIDNGRIRIVDSDFLRNLGMQEIFDDKLRENRILYQPQDLGEVYAISVAETLGVAAVVTDDIKQYGPHFTLMRMVDSDIIPFAFHEVLLLEFLKNSISAQEYIEMFEAVNRCCGLNWNIVSKTTRSIKRFLSNPDIDREVIWMKQYCASYGTDFSKKSRELCSQIKRTAGLPLH